MYVITFYSYKGGVGRTMTLVNVAAELAKRGRRVMVVDFDLEAPGLTSYGFCEAASERVGVVDYVCSYSSTSVAPDVREFVNSCELVDGNGATYSMLVMSAGKLDKNYRDNFYSINWEQLYSEQSGYLMFEDLKEQWKTFFSPDYVLIDSRTGITDISGICTRQFPDAVAITFFPNRQNLSGLRRVVSEIRAEKTGSREKEITLHFVSSNTPSADDEDGILKRNLDEFRTKLKYDNETVIHYYNSLSIVDQMVFTLNKPKTQLANEYRQLTDELVKRNPEDRDGVLAYLSDLATERSHISRFGGFEKVDARLSDLRQRYSKDGEILNHIGDVNMALLRGDVAVGLYKDAISAGFKKPDMFRNYALALRQSGETANITEALYGLLEQPDSAVVDVYFALKWLLEIDESKIASAMATPAVRNRTPDEKTFLVERLLRTKIELLPSALIILNEIEQDATVPKTKRDFVVGLKYLTLIGMGQFDEVLYLMGDRESAKGAPIHRLFNYAMAEWGASGVPPKDLFAQVILLDEGVTKPKPKGDANYPQCLALACWAVGQYDEASQWISQSKKKAVAARETEILFSCWRYINLNKAEFLKDIEMIEALIAGENLQPAVFQRKTTVH